MSRESRELEAAVKAMLVDTNEQTLGVVYDMVGLCRACNRDVWREGRCSLCQDGEKEKWAETYRNTRIDD